MGSLVLKNVSWLDTSPFQVDHAFHPSTEKSDNELPVSAWPANPNVPEMHLADSYAYNASTHVAHRHQSVTAQCAVYLSVFEFL